MIGCYEYQTRPRLSHPKYRPDIDGLRAIAVLAVVIFHAFPDLIKGGFIGVDVFFVISGYLISTIIFENLDNGTFGFFEFYSRRVNRIFPALLLVFVTCFLFGWLAFLPEELNQLGKHLAAGAGFVSNFVLWGEAGYFDNSAETKLLLHLWSLGIEEQFYIVWPLLLWLAWKRRFNLFSLAIVTAAVSFYLNLKGVKHDMVAAFYAPQSRFWELLSGSLLAWVTLYHNGRCLNIKNKVDVFLSRIIYSRHPKNNQTLENIFSFFGFSLLLFGFWRVSKELVFPGTWALIPVAGAVFIIAAGSKAWLNRIVLSNKAAVWFGLISFPLYLWHWPLLCFARIIEGETPSPLIRVALVVLAIVLAWLTVTLVERPFRFGKQRSVLKVAGLYGLMFLVGFLGLSVSKLDFSQSHGFENLVIKRKGSEHAFGSSFTWYRGKDDWLFLGNAYNDTVAKLKLATEPSQSEISATTALFSQLASVGAESNIKIVLIVGANKSSVYPEYLPAGLVPSTKTYRSFFLEALKEVPNLLVYDSTADLRESKNTQGLLYWMTDTHWNNKGAFPPYFSLRYKLGWSA